MQSLVQAFEREPHSELTTQEDWTILIVSWSVYFLILLGKIRMI